MSILVELSYTISPGMPSPPGVPGPELSELMSRDASVSHYAGGTSFLISWLSMAGNTATYLDSPYHRYLEGVDVAGLDLRRLIDLPGLVLTPRQRRDGRLVLDAGDVIDRDLCGRAVFVNTGWDQHWGTAAYAAPGPFVTAAAAEVLAANQPALVGIDCLNIDDTLDLSRPVHSVLLRAGVPLVENMRGFAALPPAGFRAFVVPLAVVGAASMPVRAFALVQP